MAKVLQRRPPQYRIVLVLRDLEEMTDDQVAEIAGLRFRNDSRPSAPGEVVCTEG